MDGAARRKQSSGKGWKRRRGGGRGVVSVNKRVGRRERGIVSGFASVTDGRAEREREADIEHLTPPPHPPPANSLVC